jgi:ferredoxin
LSLRKITRGLLDDKSINGYDFVRGEKKLAVLNSTNKKTERLLERDCIDCKQCVNVCPTGIDIVMGHKWNASIVPLVLMNAIQLWIALVYQRDRYSEDEIEKKVAFKFTLE